MHYTIKDIASEAKVSVSTVSKALNGYDDIGEGTKKHVLETVERMNYVPNTFARYISNKNTRVIGLTIPDIRDPYFAQSAYGIEEKLWENDYQVFHGNLDRKADRLLEFIRRARAMRFDGLIITPDCWNEAIKEALMRLDIPVISLRRRPPEALGIPYIDSDHYEGAMQLLKYLYGRGHRKIAHVKLPNEAGNIREVAYKDFCAQSGIEERFVSIDIPASILTDAVKNGNMGCKEVLEKWPDTTAIFAGSDFISIGVMSYLREIGKKVPDDISVVGVGNIEYARLPWFDLTTLELHRYEMGLEVAKALLRRLGGEKIDNLLFTSSLVERNSVRNV